MYTDCHGSGLGHGIEIVSLYYPHHNIIHYLESRLNLPSNKYNFYFYLYPGDYLKNHESIFHEIKYGLSQMDVNELKVNYCVIK